MCYTVLSLEFIEESEFRRLKFVAMRLWGDVCYDLALKYFFFFVLFITEILLQFSTPHDLVQLLMQAINTGSPHLVRPLVPPMLLIIKLNQLTT